MKIRQKLILPISAAFLASFSLFALETRATTLTKLVAMTNSSNYWHIEIA